MISIHKCERKMALSATIGHFEYVAMPYGLPNALCLVQASIYMEINSLCSKCILYYLRCTGSSVKNVNYG